MPADRKRLKAARPDAAASQRSSNLLQSNGAPNNIWPDRDFAFHNEEQGDRAQEKKEKNMPDQINMRDVAAAIVSVVDDMFCDCPESQREIIRENVEIAIAEGLRNHPFRGLFLGSLPAPVRALSEDEEAEIINVGKQHPWKNRADNRSPLQWVMDFYGSWVPGLLRQHIKAADSDLYAAFMTHVSRHGMKYVPLGHPPDDVIEVDIPSALENKAREDAASHSSIEGFLARTRRHLDATSKRYRRSSDRPTNG